MRLLFALLIAAVCSAQVFDPFLSTWVLKQGGQTTDPQLTTLSTPGATAKMVPTSDGAGNYVHQFVRLRSHATDCTALTDGFEGEACYEQDSNRVFVCEPTAGGCDTAGEWIVATGIANVVEDTTPTLGGNLDGGGFEITNLAGITLAGGSVAGFSEYTQGTACTPSANSVCEYAPAAIATAYGVVKPSAVGTTGVVKVAVSGAVANYSHAPLDYSELGVGVTKTYGASFFNGGSVLAATASIPFSIPTSCTVSAWTISVDAGTATFKVWKVATGTAIPTVADVINTAGVAISTGTHVRSTTLTDFTDTTWTAGDVLRIELDAVATATMANFGVECVE